MEQVYVTKCHAGIKRLFVKKEKRLIEYCENKQVDRGELIGSLPSLQIVRMMSRSNGWENDYENGDLVVGRDILEGVDIQKLKEKFPRIQEISLEPLADQRLISLVNSHYRIMPSLWQIWEGNPLELRQHSKALDTVFREGFIPCPLILGRYLNQRR
ncbi:MAG: hypothetical protein WC438_01915 [Candidatus Pacearchaeota archaeon]